MTAVWTVAADPAGVREHRVVAIETRALERDDEAWRDEVLAEGWGSTLVARRGELIDAAELPGFVALLDGQRAGLLTYRHDGDELEIVTIQSLREGTGVGRALMDAARRRAEELEATRLWLATTNNNVRALGFYQRWGMLIAAVRVRGVDESRRVKPGIPAVDESGLPIRDEIELELRFGSAATG